MFRLLFPVIGWILSRLFFGRRNRSGYGPGSFGNPYGRGNAWGPRPGPGYGMPGAFGPGGYGRGGGFLSGLLGGLGGSLLGNELFGNRGPFDRDGDGGMNGGDSYGQQSGGWGGDNLGGGGWGGDPGGGDAGGW